LKRWWAVFLISGIATVGVHYHLAATGTAENLYPVLLHFGVAFFLYLASLPAARHLGHRHPVPVLLWVFAVAAGSFAAYLHSDLLLSSEVSRYQWDGIVAESGYNPYEVFPDDPELAPLRDSFDKRIPHHERKGLYAPLAELFFFAMNRYGTDSLFHYRAVFSLMALLCGLAFLPLCRAAGVPQTRVTVFLWHPLLILETGANAHLETLSLCFVLLGLSLLIGGHQLSPVGSLAVATLIRPYPIALFPLFLRRIPPYRIVLFFLVLIVGTLPFVGAGRELWSGITDFAHHARFNPGPYLLVEWVFEILSRPEWTRPAIALLGLSIAVALYFTDDGTNAAILRRAFYLSLPPVLLGPVVNPWYMLWILPFLALVGRRNPLRMAILYLTGSVFLAYVHLEWGFIPTWVTWLEFGPVGLLAVLGIWSQGRLESPV
jgi:hypothetical protein